MPWTGGGGAVDRRWGPRSASPRHVAPGVASVVATLCSARDTPGSAPGAAQTPATEHLRTAGQQGPGGWPPTCWSPTPSRAPAGVRAGCRAQGPGSGEPSLAGWEELPGQAGPAEAWEAGSSPVRCEDSTRLPAPASRGAVVRHPPPRLRGPRRACPPPQPASCRPLSLSSRMPIWPLVEQTRMPAGALEVQGAGTPVVSGWGRGH